MQDSECSGVLHKWELQIYIAMCFFFYQNAKGIVQRGMVLLLPGQHRYEYVIAW